MSTKGLIKRIEALEQPEGKAPKYLMDLLREHMKEADIYEPVPANLSLCDALEHLIEAMPN